MRKTLAQSLLPALALCLVQALPAQAQPRDTLQKIKDTGVIELGGREASFPFSYLAGGSEPIGFSVDLCQRVVDAVKAKLGMRELKVRYTMVTPTNRIPLLQNGTIDLECSTTTNTKQRQEQVAFGPTHFVAGVGAAVKKASKIDAFADLDGKTVATTAGSTSIQLLRAYRRMEKADIKELSGKDTSEAFLMMTSDRAVALILDDVQLAGLIATTPNPADFKILPERLRDEPYGVMYRKDDPKFKEVVDGAITSAMKSGALAEIYNKWFTKPVPPKGVNLNFPMTPAVKEAYKNPNNAGV